MNLESLNSDEKWIEQLYSSLRCFKRFNLLKKIEKGDGTIAVYKIYKRPKFHAQLK